LRRTFPLCLSRCLSRESSVACCIYFSFFFLLHPAPPAFYTLSLHDALPISPPATTARAASSPSRCRRRESRGRCRIAMGMTPASDRKSTRLNSSHLGISYAVFCLKKKTEPPRYLMHSRHVEQINHAPVHPVL